METWLLSWIEGMVIVMNDYARGYAQGLIDARVMKEDADGCTGCAFEQVNSWELPCRGCKRNAKDYWRRGVNDAKVD